MEFSRRGFLAGNAVLAGAQPGPGSANNRVQVAVIGCGARSQELMVALLAHPQAEVVAVCDAYKGRLERSQDRVSGLRSGRKPRIIRDYREALADSSVDALVVATPDHWHKSIVVEAMKAGKDVYCEKPLTYRSSEGPEIIAVARQTGRILQVGSQGMSSPPQQRAREWIQSGKLGKVTMVRAVYNRNSASGAWIYPIPPDASPATVNWDLFQGPAPKVPFNLERFFRWRCFEDYSGGIATDLFVHLCTTIHFLMGAKMPSRVMAMGELYRWTESRDVPDTLNAILEYPEGFAVNLSSTFNNQSSSEESFQFLGTEGTVSLGFSGVRFFPEHVREDNRWIVESWPQNLEDQYWKNPKVIAAELEPQWKPQLQEGGTEYTAVGQEATIIHFGHFLDSLRTRQPYWEDAAAGHHAAACAHMVNRSAKSKQQVDWDFAADDVRKT
jgi:predicted dehydrogenase